MRKRMRKRLVLAFLPIAVSAGTVACEGESSVVAPELEDQAILAAMEATIQDEFKAELIYQNVLNDFGSVRPFVNIINAEVRHSEALARLFEARGLPVPRSQWSPEQIPGFSSIPEACGAGVVAEIENVEIYDRYVDLPLPLDVRTVFESNRRASIENHLPAFERCS